MDNKVENDAMEKTELEENNEPEIGAATAHVISNFKGEGEYDFMKPEELEQLAKRLVEIDFAYMDEIGEDVYDEEIVYERLYQSAVNACPQYKTYLMRFVDDYMDFMEQYLVSIGAVEWE